MDVLIEKYLDVVRKDLETLRDTQFTGNIEFKINLREGGIANMNCGKYKSVKLDG